MSRYEAKDSQGRLVIYGFDDSLGYFFDVYPGSDDSEDPIEQHDRFTGTTGGRMMDEFQERGIKIPREHVRAAAGDDPF